MFLTTRRVRHDPELVASPNSPGFVVTNPNQLTRTVVAEDFRAPATDQFSFEIQRELTSDMVWKIGYIGTRGSGLVPDR